MNKKIEKELNTFYTILKNKDQSYTTNFPVKNFIYPWFDYKTITPNNPSFDNITKVYFIYQENSKRALVSSKQRSLAIISSVLQDQKKSVPIDDIQYGNLTRHNKVESIIRNTIQLNELSFQILDFQSIPYQRIINSKGTAAPYKNLLVGLPKFTMANPNSKIDQLTCIGLQSRESVAGHNPLTVTLDCNDFRSFFKPYPPNQYKYLVKVTEVTFPTKIAPLSDGNEVTMIFLYVKGLDDAGEILFNKKKQKYLGVIKPY